MKRLKHILLLTLVFGCSSLVFTSCKTGEGCDAATNYEKDADLENYKEGKRGKSNLFSKKERKRMNK